MATLPLSMGGLGLRSAFRLRQAAHWASWGDCLEMIRDRCPLVFDRMMRSLTSRRGEQPLSIEAARQSAQSLQTAGFEVPKWEDLAEGLRPPVPPMEDGDIYQPKHGWQHLSSKCTDTSSRARLVPSLSEAERAMLRSQGGPLAACPFTCVPTSRLVRIDPQPFRVMLLRRLRLPLPFAARVCRCGRLQDVFGHHRSVCAVSGVLGGRGAALESAAVRVCREAGARVSTNVFVRDLDTVFHVTDSRRLEVVADGLPLFGGAQLAIDTTLVSALRGDGSERRHAAFKDGVALVEARRRKERTYPELVGNAERARLVVLAAEVGGRWSCETLKFLKLVANAKSRSAPAPLRGKARAAWFRRWSALLSCAAARAHALSLLERRPVSGLDGVAPHLHEVLGDSKYA